MITFRKLKCSLLLSYVSVMLGMLSELLQNTLQPIHWVYVMAAGLAYNASWKS